MKLWICVITCLAAMILPRGYGYENRCHCPGEATWDADLQGKMLQLRLEKAKTNGVNRIPRVPQGGCPKPEAIASLWPEKTYDELAQCRREDFLAKLETLKEARKVKEDAVKDFTAMRTSFREAKEQARVAWETEIQERRQVVESNLARIAAGEEPVIPDKYKSDTPMPEPSDSATTPAPTTNKTTATPTTSETTPTTTTNGTTPTPTGTAPTPSPTPAEPDRNNNSTRSEQKPDTRPSDSSTNKTNTNEPNGSKAQSGNDTKSDPGPSGSNSHDSNTNTTNTNSSEFKPEGDSSQTNTRSDSNSQQNSDSVTLPCVSSQVADDVSPPAHLVSTLTSDISIPSGRRLLLTCTRDQNNQFRKYQEQDASLDGMVDNQLGILCNNGTFVAPSSWPEVSACVPSTSCSGLPVPPNTSNFEPLQINELAIGDDVRYKCKNSGDKVEGSTSSGLDVICQDVQGVPTLGIETNDQFTPGVPDPFPRCIPSQPPSPGRKKRDTNETTTVSVEPIKKDTAKPLEPLGVMPRDGRLTEATTCKCQAGSNLRKDFNCDYEWNNKLEDPGSAEFKEFVQYCQAKIDNVLSKDSTLFQNGYLGVSLLSAKASASNSGRKKRNTGGTTTSTDVSTSGTTTGTQVDGAAASGGDSSVSSASTATPANPCPASKLTDITPPAYFESSPANPTEVASGFYLYLTCTKSGTSVFRKFQETAPASDDAVDQKLGVMCNNGAFVAPTAWPEETSCVETPSCTGLPTPAADARFNAQPLTEIAQGDSVSYTCTDTEAVLSDGSGLNALSVKCQDVSGTPTLGTDSGSGFVALSGSFPTCRSQCKNFDIGKKQYSPLNTTLEYRAGDDAEFVCPVGFHVEGMAFTVTSVTKKCLTNGSFEIEIKSCSLIPCDDDDITSITPASGEFSTSAKGPVTPPGRILFTCTDAAKRPADGRQELESVCEKGGTFTNLTLPEGPDGKKCVLTCSNFTNHPIPNMIPTNTGYVLGGKKAEFKCRSAGRIPETGSNVEVECDYDGVLQYEDAKMTHPNGTKTFPSCVIGCLNFPDYPSFRPSSRSPLLPGNKVTYECLEDGFVPHTDEKLELVCLGNGTLIPNPNKTFPICIAPNHCKPYSALPNYVIPKHPDYVVNDPAITHYKHGASMEMRCKNTDFVAEDKNRTWTKTTFGVKCEGDANSPSFQPPPEADWPRCIPRSCVGAEFQNLQDITGQCTCEFTECTQYVFENFIENQCPEAPSGPFCGLISYQDDTNETMALFNGAAPEVVPTASEMVELDLLATDLDSVSTRLENTTTEPTTTARKKRSLKVPVTCAEVKSYVDAMVGLLDDGTTTKVYQSSLLRRYCAYILESKVTNVMCKDENGLAGLQSSFTTLKTKIADFKTTKTSLKALHDEYASKASNLNTQAKQNISAADAATLKAVQEANFRPYTPPDPNHQMLGKTLPSDMPSTMEVTMTESAVKSVGSAITDVDTNMASPPANSTNNRKKREVQSSFSCRHIQDRLERIHYLLNFGLKNKFYMYHELSELATSILESKVDYDTCVFEKLISYLKPKATELRVMLTSVSMEVQELSRLANGVITPSGAVMANNRSQTLLDLATALEITGRPNRVVLNPDNYNTDGTVKNTTETPSQTRRKRAIALHFLHSRRAKRSINFRCNKTMVYGIKVLEIHNASRFQAERCCCPNFRGELFNLFVTIDTPWTNSLIDRRNKDYKDKLKMVDQEIRALLTNKKYSWIAADEMIVHLNFTSFQKTSGNKIGVNFEVLLNRPNWNNDYRIEQSFKIAADEYASRNETSVLGVTVLGAFEKNDYVTNQGKKALEARRKDFPDENGSGSGSGDGSGDNSEDNTMATGLVVALTLLAVIILIGIPIFVAFRSRACLFKYCFAKGKVVQ